MSNGNQITIGGFKDNGRMITGWISTSDINAPYVELRPWGRTGKKSPSFKAWARGREGNLYHLGTLWPKETKRGGLPFHGGFITSRDRGKRFTMNVALFGDLASGADMVSREDDGDYFANSAPSGRDDDQQQTYGGLSGGSTVGPNGEYVGQQGEGGNAFDAYNVSNPADGLDDEVQF